MMDCPKKPDSWPNCLVLTNIPPETQDDLIKNYAEVICKRNVTSFNRQKICPSVAVVQFETAVTDQDISAWERRLEEKRLCRNRVTIQALGQPNGVVVKNVPHDVTDELLELYFENKRSGGLDGSVIDVDNKANGTYVVRINDLSEEELKSVEINLYECLSEVKNKEKIIQAELAQFLNTAECKECLRTKLRNAKIQAAFEIQTDMHLNKIVMYAFIADELKRALEFIDDCLTVKELALTKGIDIKSLEMTVTGMTSANHTTKVYPSSSGIFICSFSKTIADDFENKLLKNIQNADIWLLMTGFKPGLKHDFLTTCEERFNCWLDVSKEGEIIPPTKGRS
ncbi:hypothetical protein MAR_022310, partial [Mya arenaria]